MRIVLQIFLNRDFFALTVYVNLAVGNTVGKAVVGRGIIAFDYITRIG